MSFDRDILGFVVEEIQPINGTKNMVDGFDKI